MRDWQGDLEWYRTHQTAAQIGFNPDGMCLKVCRTSRDIGPMFATAKQAQDNTPKEHRVYKVRDLRKGMKIFFDDPNDSNKAGHIVTMIGRAKGFDWDDLNDVLVETNSVVSGQLVVVRATYFKEHWGDDFQFGATWLNGQVLDVPAKKPAKPAQPSRLENFWDTRPEWDVKILDRVARSDVSAIVSRVEKAVEDLPDDKDDSRVEKFKDRFAKDRVLDMRLLNQAVADGRTGRVKSARDRINAALKKLPRR